MINPEQLEHQSSESLSVMMNDYERKIQAATEILSTVEMEKLLLQRQIIDLQGRKKDLEISVEKGRQNVRALESDHRILKTVYWNNRNAGL